MDLSTYLKLGIKKSLGRFMGRFKSAKDEYLYLRGIVPQFMRERLADKPADRRFLIMSIGSYDAKSEALYAKALETIGYEPYIVVGYDPYVSKIFELYGINKVYYYEDFFKRVSLKDGKSWAFNCLQNMRIREVLTTHWNGIGVGKFAASDLMRRTRAATIDLKNDTMKTLLAHQMAYSLRAAVAAESIVREIKPDLLFVTDRGYTPVGQLFDACLSKGIQAISRNASHKSGWDILKRYSEPKMSIIHPHSLSKESWEYIMKMPWGDDKWHELYNEISLTYASGDWFSVVGTQFKKKIYSKEGLLSIFDLDPRKKIAIIFPHMFWDATFFWGVDLFTDYYDWFINVLKVAAKNDKVNWIIKIHPANLVKAKRDKYRGEHKELTTVYEVLGQLPGHIRVIPPESNINTFSLFSMMDYCLTVRGTIGIEAAVFGINTLTAGTGRYDRYGFTRDFDSADDYLTCLRTLQELPRMTDQAIELARRYAYGIFIMRPIGFDLLEYRFNQDDMGTMTYRPRFKGKDEFEASSFVNGFRDFVTSGKEDYLAARI